MQKVSLDLIWVNILYTNLFNLTVHNEFQFETRKVCQQDENVNEKGKSDKVAKNSLTSCFTLNCEYSHWLWNSWTLVVVQRVSRSIALEKWLKLDLCVEINCVDQHWKGENI